MKIIHTILLLIIPIAFLSNLAPNISDEIKLNDIQIIGSHNSYKIGVDGPLLEYLLKSRRQCCPY